MTSYPEPTDRFSFPVPDELKALADGVWSSQVEPAIATAQITDEMREAVHQIYGQISEKIREDNARRKQEYDKQPHEKRFRGHIYAGTPINTSQISDDIVRVILTILLAHRLEGEIINLGHTAFEESPELNLNQFLQVISAGTAAGLTPTKWRFQRAPQALSRPLTPRKKVKDEEPTK